MPHHPTRTPALEWVETDHIACGFAHEHTGGRFAGRVGVTQLWLGDPTYWPVDQLVPLRSVWLWPEYYLRKGFTDRGSIPSAPVVFERRDDQIVYHYPTDPEVGIAMDVAFGVDGHTIDARYTVTAEKHYTDFELFMASYVDAALGETWVPARGIAANGGWVQVDNRRHVWGCWMVLANPASARRLFDGRWDFIRDAELEHHAIAGYLLDRPIMVARSAVTGAAAVFLGDPRETTLVGGQYHERDTAHDFGLFGKDLQPGQSLEARVRVVLVPGTQQWDPTTQPDMPPLWQIVDRLWQQWLTEA